jgi:hypothetical protein
MSEKTEADLVELFSGELKKINKARKALMFVFYVFVTVFGLAVIGSIFYMGKISNEVENMADQAKGITSDIEKIDARVEELVWEMIRLNPDYKPTTRGGTKDD